MRAKLVRDRLEGIPSPGGVPERHILLSLKLHEEACELADAPHDLAEYADVLEVLMEMARTHGIPWEVIERARTTKRLQKGGFELCKIAVTKCP